MKKKRQPKTRCFGCHKVTCQGQCMQNVSRREAVRNIENKLKELEAQLPNECDHRECKIKTRFFAVITAISVACIFYGDWYWQKKFDAIPAPVAAVAYRFVPNQLQTEFNRQCTQNLKECQSDWKHELAKNKRLRESNLELRTANTNCIERMPQ